MQNAADQLKLLREKGSYLLMLTLPSPKEIQVGRLGCIAFARGWYAYAGSAFGPGGLAARLRHHLRPVQRPHWHLDYLRAEAVVTAAWMAAGAPCREHDWASGLTKGVGAGSGIRGFGCSDCCCPSHLVYFDRRPGEAWIRKRLGEGVVRLQCRASAAATESS